MILHTVNKSPFESDLLNACLRTASEHSGILLLEDGVYGALASAPASALLKQMMATHNFYVLQADVVARGIADTIISGFEVVDYPRFVELCSYYHCVQAWY